MNNSLHTLIHGLTQSEKRYFTIQSNLGSPEESKQYYQLFESILSQVQYDEKALKDQVGHRYFAQYKKQLEDKIMFCLRQFNAGKSMTDVVNDELQNVRIYEQKGLFKRAEKCLKRAEELARRFELLPELLRVFDFTIPLIAKTATVKEIRERIPQIREEIATIHRLIDLSLHIRQEFLHFSTLNKENEFLRDKLAAQDALSVIASLNSITGKQQLTAKAQAQLHYLNGLCYFLCGNFTESRLAFSREYQTYTHYPFISAETPESFDTCIGNNALLALVTGNSDEFAHYFRELSLRLEQRTKKNPVDLYRCYVLQLKAFVKQQKWAEGKRYKEENQAIFQLLEKELRQQQLLKTELDYVLFDKLRIHLETGAQREARQLLHAFFNEAENTQKTDNYIMARFLFIFLQLQQEQYDLAESEIRSLKRFIRNNKRAFAFENQTLNYLSKLVANPLPEKQHQTLKAFTEVVETMKSDINGQMALFCFDLSCWLQGLQLRQ